MPVNEENVLPVGARKAGGGTEVWLHFFVTSAVDESEW